MQVEVPQAAAQQYCAANSKSTSYEWIKSIEVEGLVYESGPSPGGYFFVQDTHFQLNYGENLVTVIPGFNGGPYNETLSIFVDLNQDGQFTADEKLADRVINQRTVETVVIPSTAKPGKTRMRVMLQYANSNQACGEFQYGEVEDHVIQVGDESAEQEGMPSAGSSISYCPSSSNSASSEWIKTVKLNGVASNSSNDGGGYKKFENPILPLVMGTNDIEITPGFASWGGYNEGYAVFIDLNKNGEFSEDEKVFFSSGVSTVSGKITIPVTAQLGTTTMRVIQKYSGLSDIQACGNFSYGEVEDHPVVIDSQSLEAPSQPTSSYSSPIFPQ